MKCERPPGEICFRRFGRGRGHFQGGLIIFHEVRFVLIAIGIFGRFCQSLSQSVLGLDSLSCSDQKKSIQGLNMLRSGDSVQFLNAILGFATSQVSCQLSVSVSVFSGCGGEMHSVRAMQSLMGSQRRRCHGQLITDTENFFRTSSDNFL
jgi:hypothetical protein